MTSPTFNILLTYPAGSLPLYHFSNGLLMFIAP
ncbi:tRNA (adenosine(37)-N6)-threonylcarbamoyltransferase complex ATPase subunit type 1 TsaE [Eggerthella lenta]|nr:tRNA (adenosine(37)-N6)-threonylcarbamoyltransferase complex ATPase subunit type 1 TsaE [Eggerthella lenta]